MNTPSSSTTEFYQTLLLGKWLENSLAAGEKFGSQFVTTVGIEKSVLVDRIRQIQDATYMTSPAGMYFLDAIQERSDLKTLHDIRKTMQKMSASNMVYVEAIAAGMAEGNQDYPGDRLQKLLVEATTMLELEQRDCRRTTSATKVIPLEPTSQTSRAQRPASHPSS